MNNPISMSDFATDFNYVSENDAEMAYKDSLSKYIIPQKLRQSLIAAYDVWKRNEGITFWASRKVSSSLEYTAGELASESKYVAKDLIRNNRIAIEPSASKEPVQTEVSGTNSIGKETQSTDEEFVTIVDEILSQSKRKASEISDEEESTKPTSLLRTPHVDDHSNVLLSRLLFDEEDQVDQFFFNNPISEWTNVRAFCSDLSKKKHLISSKKAYRRYTKSLDAIRHKTAVDGQVREHASNILRIRESSFRTDYFYIENLLHQDAANARKILLVEAEEEEPPHLVLHFELVSGESEDEDFQLGDKESETDSAATHDEELTGEIPEPIEIDCLVGPGEFSSQLSTEGCLVIGDCDISTTVMRHRRTIITQSTLTDVEDLLLVFVAALTLASCREEWFEQEPRLASSIVYRAISSYFWEAGLWSDCNWYRKGAGDNEDTFTNCLIKPLLAGTFGDFAGCSFRWSRDSLRSGRSEDPDARLQLPDYQVSIGAHSIVLGEFKTAMAPKKAMQDDYVKLVFMGKKAVDGLYKAGFLTPVILIHGRGMLVDVYRLSIHSEAIYHLQSLGTFRLVSGPLELSLLLGIGPLVSAR
ncbi:hypothetical protein BGZ76_003790, partial [Entomortierella beljakovae]